ncbi:hypothetical protein [Halanaerobacter jeridensis]|uniref:CRISPR/Cas system CMR-associated protein Cmr5 small subunit n=1 Tax=Halanaerobacter jeridensis TaxID=706427 RepID=A0A938XRG8_9FIRM|nr:hypothetical protein [Halanaerobacter jeridensis]MBM7556090.1 CRISPR/Cas system CMR-associated protein Cmr5 small subunit [Halanaerobacter jeridensis]
MRQFYVPKLEGDYSDILLCRGIAEIVKQVLIQSGEENPEIVIKDMASFYQIESDKELIKENFTDVEFKTLYPLIYYDKMDNKPDYTEDIVDFTLDEEYKEWSATKHKSNLIRQTTGVPLSNKIMNDVYSIKEYFGELLFIILDSFSEPQGDYSQLSDNLDQLFIKIQLNKFKKIIKNELSNSELEEIENNLDQLFEGFDNYHWSKRNKVKKIIQNQLPESENVTNITENIKELYNQAKLDFTESHNALSSLLPKRVKGLNRDDLSSTSRISPKNSSESWFKLFLILIGFYKLFMLKSLNSGNRLYSVIIPNQVLLDDFDSLYYQIEPDYYPANTLEKQNILFLSDFIIKLLDKLEQFDNRRRRRRRKLLRNYIQGLKNAYLVDMGQNHVIKNIYDLNIPNWIVLDEEKDKVKFKEVFQEFMELIRPIDDKNEDIKIFQELYKFLTTEKVDYLLNYYYQHAVLAIQRLANDNGAKIYTKRGVKFIMSKLENVDQTNYSSILENEGFQNFAEAIRNSTLIPIYHNDKKKIKFGLLQDLRRAALNKETLVTELSEFMADYNNENGLENFHNNNPMRSNLTTKDFEQLVNLIDEHDSEIIGNMLLAYGFGKDEKVEEVKEGADNNE